MERLTEKRDGQNVIPLRQNGKTKWSLCGAGMGNAPTRFLYGEYADKLAEYEDLEEQGKLRIFPCAIGETVYCVYNKYQKCDSKKEYCIRSEKVQSLDWIVEQEKHKRFGKTVFLTKSAAEQALKEMEGKK